MKKEPPARPPAPVRRQKRSAKMSGESKIKDSPFPERAALSPTRPPRRGSSSSLVDQQKYVEIHSIEIKIPKMFLIFFLNFDLNVDRHQ